MARILVFVQSATDGSARLNTLLTNLGHTVTVVTDGATNQVWSNFDLIMTHRTGSAIGTTLRQRILAGQPVIFGGVNPGDATPGTNTATDALVAAGLATASSVEIANSNTLGTAHAITAGLSNPVVTHTAVNYAAAYTGLGANAATLLLGSTGALANKPTMVLWGPGGRFTDNTLIPTTVIGMNLYANQSDYTADGALLIERAVGYALASLSMASAGVGVMSFSVPAAAHSAGKAEMTIRETALASREGDIFLLPSTPQPGDITMSTRYGPDSMAGTSCGGATASMGLTSFMAMVSPAAGVSTAVAPMDRFMPHAWDISGGRTEITSNRMLVVLATDYFTIYASNPPYEATDVLLADRDGPATPSRANTSMVGGFWLGGDMIGGDYQASEGPPPAGAMFAVATALATMTAALSESHAIRAEAAGQATMTAVAKQVYAVTSTSAGRATVTAYLGSPSRQEATSNGRGGARDQFGTTGRWYLGSSTHLTATSAGRATVPTNLLGAPVRMIVTSNGVGRLIAYLGTPAQVAMTSAGRATGSGYLSTRIYLTSTAAGRATMATYLGSPFHVFSTAAGKGGGILYMGSRVYMAGTSPGRAGASIYLSSQVPQTWTAEGEAVASAHIAEFVSLFSRAIRGIATASMQPHRGPQHYGPGTWTSRGVGTMFLDPGLLSMTVRGIGHVNNIPRPDQVWMRWGSGEFYYEQHFPLIAPLLIPNGSNGMSNVRIEIDTVPIMHHHSDGVAGGEITAAGIERRSRMQTITGGCYDWTVHSDDAEAGLVGTRRPWFGSVGALNVTGSDYVYIRHAAAKEFLGIKMTLTPVPVVWWPKGVATVKMFPTINFYRRWQTWTDGEPFYPFPYQYGGPHPYVRPSDGASLGATRRAGGVGTMRFKGPFAVSGISQGRANIGVINRLGVAYVSNLIAVGVSDNWLLNIGDPLDLLYGDMLAQNFSVALPPFGQLWPRRFHLSGLPV